MKVSHLTLGFLIFGLLFACVTATAPSEQGYMLHDMFVDRTYRFFDALLHVLGVAALIKYLFGR